MNLGRLMCDAVYQKMRYYTYKPSYSMFPNMLPNPIFAAKFDAFHTHFGMLFPSLDIFSSLKRRLMFSYNINDNYLISDNKMNRK